MFHKVLFILASVTAMYNVRVLHFLPQLKLHHVVVIKDKSMYAIDFTPINQSEFFTIGKLFLGQNVPAKIRVIPLQNSSFDNEESLIAEWNHLRENSYTYDNVSLFKGWKNDSMNLYFHNCHHFSEFLQENYQFNKFLQEKIFIDAETL